MIEEILANLLKRRLPSVGDFEERTISIAGKEHVVYIPAAKLESLVGSVAILQRKDLEKYVLLQNRCLVEKGLAEQESLLYSSLDSLFSGEEITVSLEG